MYMYTSSNIQLAHITGLRSISSALTSKGLEALLVTAVVFEVSSECLPGNIHGCVIFVSHISMYQKLVEGMEQPNDFGLINSSDCRFTLLIQASSHVFTTVSLQCGLWHRKPVSASGYMPVSVGYESKNSLWQWVYTGVRVRLFILTHTMPQWYEHMFHTALYRKY